MNWVLCGMMGSGKSTVGKLLAEILQWEWVDTDELIVSRYGDIAGIFKQKGEAYFRTLEKEVVEELTKKDRLVISTGGGLVLQKDNVAILKENGEIVYLRATQQTLVNRLRGDTERPLLQTTEKLEEKMAELLRAREEIYASIADYIVDVDEKTPEEIAREILAQKIEMRVAGTR